MRKFIFGPSCSMFEASAATLLFGMYVTGGMPIWLSIVLMAGVVAISGAIYKE